MEETFFNLNNPFEKNVYERLKGYLEADIQHDKVLNMIGRDFPYMDTRIRELCENTVYLHFHSGEDGQIVARLKDAVLLHSSQIDEPFYSHKARNFKINDDEDIIVAVMVENPLYLYDKANVHLTFHMKGEKINEFKHTMKMEERRNIYYVPLKANETCDWDGSDHLTLHINVSDENNKGFSIDLNGDLYRGDMNASDIFSVDNVTVFDQNESGPKESFDLGSLKSLDIFMSVNRHMDHEDISDIEGVITINRNDSTNKRESLANSIYLSESLDDAGILEGGVSMFLTRRKESDYDRSPVFKPQSGTYTISLYIWNTLIWSKEIEFTGELSNDEQEDCEDEAIRWLQRLEAGLDMGKAPEVKPDTKPAPSPGINPYEYVEVTGLALYNVNSTEDDNDRCLDNMVASPQRAFRAEGLKMLSVIGKVKKLKDTDILDQENFITWSLYDQTGRLLDWNFAKKETIQSELWFCCAFGDFCNQEWGKGTYRLEMEWQSNTLINAVFTIGDADVTSEYEASIISRKENVVRNSVEGSALERLDKMAGLKQVKQKIHDLMNYHKFQKMRQEAGLPVKQPSLHAQFLGSPGTGKTTVARLLGQIYKEMGLLSSGHVVLEERKNMIGRFYDSEGMAVENALNRAKGGILLIDEAYNLYVEEDEKDPGRRILEYLLTALSDEENRDWMLILAGYTDEMKKLEKFNPGLKSRVNEMFYFDDLNVDELLEIADLYCDDNSYELSEEARERLKSIITRDVAAKDKSFGNGRYVKKLMETTINTRMATRLSKIEQPTYDQLVTIEADDIPISVEEAERIASEGFDDEAIDKALKRLDSLVGLGKVKSAIHNFVNISRFLNSQGERIRGKGLLKWNFTGNTGTGKSTVAQILADILKAMNLIQNNEITEVKGEEIFNVSDYTCNEVIRDAVKKSRRGLLFIDGDAPEFRSSHYRMTSEQIRFKLATLASEDNASGALIIAECSTPDLSMAHSLASNGIYDFDHTFIFDDYSADELYEILLQCLYKQKTKVSEEAEVILREYILNLCANRDLSFANARTMKNLARAIFDTVILRMSEKSTPQQDRIVLDCDVESFVWKRRSSKIGF